MHDDHHHHDHHHDDGLHSPPGAGHNHAHGVHLHSHAHGVASHERREELKVLTSAFVDGFRAAADKTSYLRLAAIPFQRTGSDGLSMHLVDATIICHWQIGTASPAFGSRELAYLPYPGSMVTERETMRFTYVSVSERSDIDLTEILSSRMEREEEL